MWNIKGNGDDMSLKLYNTMKRKIEDFVPINDDCVGFYGCGPTVYKYVHIGNLRAFVFQDTLVRVLSFLGYKVKHVMNITDIGHLSDDGDEGEDKMVKSARERGMNVAEIADIYINAFFNDIDRLNIKRPSIVCRATEHIQDMIELIKKIEENGHTYMSAGNLYFDISTFPDYGKLGGVDIKTLKPGARIAVDKNKKNPNDFVLWFTNSKFENHALSWESPWGRGYPGWHIECSAMSIKYLGEQFDIHSGGIDHIRVHHTNEIAQSESATGKKWVNYWLHNEFLITNQGKMSKSMGSTFTLDDIIREGFSPLDYRFLLLTGHYRKKLLFSWDALKTAQSSRKKIEERVVKILKKCSEDEINELSSIKNVLENYSLDEYIERNITDNTLISILNKFKETIEKDLNIPNALPFIHMAIKEKNASPKEILKTIGIIDLVFGLNIIDEGSKLIDYSDKHTTMEISKIEELIEERNKAKREKDYKKADEIRDNLKMQGILLEDTSNGTKWKILDI